MDAFLTNALAQLVANSVIGAIRQLRENDSRITDSTINSIIVNVKSILAEPGEDSLLSFSELSDDESEKCARYLRSGSGMSCALLVAQLWAIEGLDRHDDTVSQLMEHGLELFVEPETVAPGSGAALGDSFG